MNRRPTARLLALAASAAMATPLVAVSGATAQAAAPDEVSSDFALAVGPQAAPQAAQSGCQLANGVQHVFYIGFDNFHLRRDNANNVANNGDDNHNTDLNIPSDLEQVPALYNFIRGTSNAGTSPNASTANNANYADGRSTTYTDGSPYPGGTLLANEHTPLIAHTSVDFTTSYAGVYGDRHGVAVSQNSIAAYTGNATTPVSSTSGFSYWTDPLGIGNDPTTVITTKDSNGNPVNAPAPWVPYTRAGCDVGAVSATGFTLENAKSASNASTSTVTLTTADEGIAVHCAQGSTFCGLSSTDSKVKAVPDKLPSEPGGYTGFNAIYGHEYVAPAINDKLSNTTSGGSTTLSLLRSPSTSSFPGFNGEDGNYTLGYALDMQKAGIPVTFGYLNDAHQCYSSVISDYGNASASGATRCNYTNASGSTAPSSYGAFGSGEAGYVAYLKQLNTDFQTFFDQAKAAGYTTANTEFVFYSDESDHVSEATPANGTGTTPCDGVTTPCAYNHSTDQESPTAGQLGELDVNLDQILPSRSQQANQPYFLLNDSAPDFYLENSGSAAAPGQTDTNVRSFEQDLGAATYTDPFTGQTAHLVKQEADQAELNALHMVTSDPQRTPTFTAFAPGEDYVQPSGGCASGPTCSVFSYAYVHGDYAPEVNTIWAAFVGPGVKNLGVDGTDWVDHVDLRPTLLALLGLSDDYTDEGRVITQIIQPGAVSSALQTSTATDLGTLLKKIDAPVYESSEGAHDGFGTATLDADTTVLEGTNASTYSDVESRISTITAQRNTVVADILSRLAGAQAGTPIDATAASTDESEGQCLLAYANQLKAYAASPTSANAPTDCSVAVGTNLPEASHTSLMVLAGGVIAAAVLLLLGRRRRTA